MRSVQTSIEGMPRLLKRFQTLDFVGRGARDFLRDWSDTMKKEAKDRVSVFTGGTKLSIESEIEGGVFPKSARVYSDDPKARWLDMGTGALSVDPKSSKNPYFPPPENLAPWARFHGLDPYSVALGIFERGGTPPTYFWSAAEEAASRSMAGQLQRFGASIEYNASRSE